MLRAVKLRIRSYLAVAFLVASAIPILLFLAWPQLRSADREMQAAREQHLLIAEGLATSLVDYHEDITALVDTFASLIAAGGGEDARPLFERLHFRHLCVADPATGAVLVSFLAETHACPATVPAERLALFNRLAEAAPVGLSPLIQPPGETPRIFLAAKTGPSLVIAALETTFFKDLISDIHFGEAGHAVIIDQTGRTLAHPHLGLHPETVDLSQISLVERLAQGENGVEAFFSPVRQQQMIAGFAAVPGAGWGVMVPQPQAELTAAVSRFVRDALLILGLGAGLSLLLAGSVSVQVSRRLGEIAAAVHQLAVQSDAARVRPSRGLVRIRELTALEDDVNSLADSSTAARKAQAAHQKGLEEANTNLRREMADRRAAEVAQKSSEARFKSLFESAPIPIREEDLSGMKRLIDGLGIADPAAFGRYLDANPEFLAVCSQEIVVVDANQASLDQHGYTDKSKMLRRVVRKLSPDAMKIVRMTVEALHAGLPSRSYETKITRADGSKRDVAATWSVVPGYEKTYGRILLCSVDLTERLKSEAEARHAQKMQAVGQLTGGVAHDFNNLLTVIGGNIDLMEVSEAFDGDLVDPVKRAVERGAELTQRLLAYSRKQPLEPQTFDLGRLVRRTNILLRRSLGEEIEITTAIAPDLWSVRADPGQVEAALLNMALNARDAMPEGGRLIISLSNAVIEPGHARDVEPGDFVGLSVSDTGHGMTPDVSARAYEPFFTTKEVGKGSGLGLSTIYGFAKQSKGDVVLESAPGEGTTVTLYLPSAEPLPAASPVDVLAAANGGRGQTILVLEDDDDVRQYLTRLVTSFGYRAIPAATAAEAQDLVKAGAKIDLLLSDVMLPGGMLGPEFAQRLVTQSPQTKVIFISGRPSDAGLPDAPQIDGATMLAKPFSKEDLWQHIEMALGQYETQAPRSA